MTSGQRDIWAYCPSPAGAIVEEQKRRGFVLTPKRKAEPTFTFSKGSERPLMTFTDNNQLELVIEFDVLGLSPHLGKAVGLFVAIAIAPYCV